MTSEPIWQFLIGIGIVHLYPGPDRILVLSKSLSLNWRAGVLASLGVFGATFGTSLACYLLLLSDQDAYFFFVIRVIGAAYLVLLGIKHLTKWKFYKAGAEQIGTTSMHWVAWEGFTLHFLNPMAYIFPLSFFIQFVDQNQIGLSFIKLALVGASIALLFNVLFALWAGYYQKVFVSKTNVLVLDIITGLLFIYFGLKTIADLKFL